MKATPKQRRRVIRFYDRGAPYFEFTNFSPHPILVDGLLWPTSEHYFQSQKFAGTWLEERFRLSLERPRDAFAIARLFRARQDWDAIRDGVMRTAVIAKFTQHDDLRRMLVGTGSAVLIEHTANDAYWGDGGNGLGENMLGRILMSVREELR